MFDLKFCHVCTYFSHDFGTLNPFIQTLVRQDFKLVSARSCPFRHHPSSQDVVAEEDICDMKMNDCYPSKIEESPKKMKKNLDEILTVVIRSIGERTENKCYQLIEKQISKRNIFIVRKTPFTESIKESFKIAIEEKRKWLLCIDADVLVRENAINDLLEFAEKADSKTFVMRGDIVDKFLDSPRSAGIHLYKTKYLKEAITEIPLSKNAIRPESAMIEKMENRGYKHKKLDIFVGIHDFEQYYEDIYRKLFVHGKKHFNRIIDGKVLEGWKVFAEIDSDYVVAIEGFKDGHRFKKNVEIDSNAVFMKDFKNVLNKLGLKEKVEFQGENLSYVDEIYGMLKFNNILFKRLKRSHKASYKKEKTIICYLTNFLSLFVYKKSLRKKLRKSSRRKSREREFKRVLSDSIDSD